MNIRANLLLFLALIILPPASYGEEVVCPETIVTKQTLSKSVPGFSAFLRQGHDNSEALVARVSGVEIYSGDPNELAQLVPDNVNDKGFPQSGSRWALDPTSQEKYPIYIACTYYQTAVRVVKMVSTKVKECSYTLPRHGAATKVVCR